MKALLFIAVALLAIGVSFGIDAGAAEILHLVFPKVLSFWKWFGIVMVASFLLGSVRSRSKG